MVEVHPDSATIYDRVTRGETLPLEVSPLGEPKATSQLRGLGKAKKNPNFFKKSGFDYLSFWWPRTKNRRTAQNQS